MSGSNCSGGFRRPGLVVALRRTTDGWEAYVAILRDDSVLVSWEKATALGDVPGEVAQMILGHSSPAATRWPDGHSAVVAGVGFEPT